MGMAMSRTPEPQANEGAWQSLLLLREGHRGKWKRFSLVQLSMVTMCAKYVHSSFFLWLLHLEDPPTPHKEGSFHNELNLSIDPTAYHNPYLAIHLYLVTLPLCTVVCNNPDPCSIL